MIQFTPIGIYLIDVLGYSEDDARGMDWDDLSDEERKECEDYMS